MSGDYVDFWTNQVNLDHISQFGLLLIWSKIKISQHGP